MIEDEKSIADFLRRIELTEKEIKIYLALLEINGSAASILGKKAGIANRSTAKYICESLLKRGLITGEKQNGAVIYSLEWPEKFLYLLERKKEDIKEQEKVAHRVVGKLKSLMNISVLPKVKFFEGKDSFAKAYETILMKTISFCNYL
jgi:sugar-specific transcriptional regulator TrmB